MVESCIKSGAEQLTLRLRVWDRNSKRLSITSKASKPKICDQAAKSCDEPGITPFLDPVATTPGFCICRPTMLSVPRAKDTQGTLNKSEFSLSLRDRVCAQALGNQRYDAAGNIDGGLDVPSVSEMARNVDAAHVCFKCFRIIDWDFS